MFVMLFEGSRERALLSAAKGANQHVVLICTLWCFMPFKELKTIWYVSFIMMSVYICIFNNYYIQL